MKKILTVIIDGFGLREEMDGNAIKHAVMPNFDRLWNEYPRSILQASGEHVGLPKGVVGNSEVGHSTLGAGCLQKQEEVIIDEAFENNEFDENEVFKETIDCIKNENRKVHLMILCSDGSVHSNIKHLFRMMEKLKSKGIQNAYLHLITDGRDTDIHSSFKYIKSVKDTIKSLEFGTIASICGRYYAMDRDNKWDRIKRYYDLLISGVGIETKSIMKTIQSCYLKNVTDEFIPPILVERDGLLNDGDVLLWLNFRNERAREILYAITNSEFNHFPVKKMPNLKLVSFFDIYKRVNGKSLIKQDDVETTLGIYLDGLGLTQARISETEKYAHITRFFDCEIDKKLDGCDNFHISSPKVDTYDKMPQMSALEVCKKTIECIEKDYDFILVNFNNPDMVGHTGDLIASVKAVQVVDVCLGKVVEVAKENFYTVVILSDHGNADIVLDETGRPVTTHTLSPVPFIITDKKIELKGEGDLTMVAPTILEYMDIALPPSMKGTETLLKK